MKVDHSLIKNEKRVFKTMCMNQQSTAKFTMREIYNLEWGSRLKNRHAHVENNRPLSHTVACDRERRIDTSLRCSCTAESKGESLPSRIKGSRNRCQALVLPSIEQRNDSYENPGKFNYNYLFNRLF